MIGVRRLLALLARYQIKATFFIPGVLIGTYPEVCANIVGQRHEVGHHQPPAKMTPDQEEAGTVRRCEAIRKLSGKIRAANARRPGTSVAELLIPTASSTTPSSPPGARRRCDPD